MYVGRSLKSIENCRTALALAVDFIAGHYAEPLCVTAVSNAVNLSVSRLAHVFPAATGLAVMD
jgi:AraC-like DNA-binding protein